MKLKLVSGCAAIALLMFGIVVESLGAPGHCLQFPIYDDGIDALWLADFYALQPGCVNPEEVYVWGASTLTSPELCGACQPRMFVVDAKYSGDQAKANERLSVCHKLKNPLPLNHQFKNGLPPKAKAKLNGTEIPWIPHTAAKVSPGIWVLVTSTDAAKPLPVQLFIVELDFAAAEGLPPAAWAGKPQIRTVRVGFEMTKLPKNIDPEAVPLLTAEKAKNAPANCKTEGLVWIDAERKPFRIVTASDLLLP